MLGFTVLNLKEINNLPLHGASGCACIFFTLCYLDQRREEAS